MSESTAYRAACDMEAPLTVVSDLLNALIYMGEGISDKDLSSAVQQIATLALREVENAQGLRDTIFSLVHPNSTARSAS